MSIEVKHKKTEYEVETPAVTIEVCDLGDGQGYIKMEFANFEAQYLDSVIEALTMIKRRFGEAS